MLALWQDDTRPTIKKTCEGLRELSSLVDDGLTTSLSLNHHTSPGVHIRVLLTFSRVLGMFQ